MMLMRAVKEALILLLVATVIGVVVYAVRPDKIPPPSVANSPGENAPAAEEKALTTISIDDAIGLYQEDKAIFIDARHGVDYAAGHIKKAINLTIDESASWLSDFIAATDPQTVIITYCDGEHCHLAPELAELLFFNGFDHVFYLENGWTRWRDHGYPIQ